MSKQINEHLKTGIFLSIVLIAIVALSGCANNASVKSNSQPAVSKTAKTVSPPAGIDTDKDGIPDNAELVLGTDPANPDTDGDGINDKADNNPTLVDQPFEKSVGANDFSIQNVLVENNIDETTKQAAPDHLEIILKNNSALAINDFKVYYEFTDLKNNTVESYELLLSGFTLDANQTKSVHIDVSGQAGHFRANPNSSYYQNQDAKTVKVIVSAPGHEAQEMTVKKDEGGAETAD